MDLVLKIIIALVGVIAGIACMRYNYQITQLFGYNDLAERYLRAGGTYSMWRLLGLILVIISVIYVFS